MTIQKMASPVHPTAPAIYMTPITLEALNASMDERKPVQAAPFTALEEEMGGATAHQMQKPGGEGEGEAGG